MQGEREQEIQLSITGKRYEINIGNYWKIVGSYTMGTLDLSLRDLEGGGYS